MPPARHPATSSRQRTRRPATRGIAQRGVRRHKQQWQPRQHVGHRQDRPHEQRTAQLKRRRRNHCGRRPHPNPSRRIKCATPGNPQFQEKTDAQCHRRIAKIKGSENGDKHRVRQIARNGCPANSSGFHNTSDTRSTRVKKHTTENSAALQYWQWIWHSWARPRGVLLPTAYSP